MNKKIKKEDLSPLASYVNEFFDGDLLSLMHSLDRAIYMFHYLPEEENFSAREKQNVCFALMGLKESLMEGMG